MIKYRYLPDWNKALTRPIVATDNLPALQHLSSTLSQYAFTYPSLSELACSLFQLTMNHFHEDLSLLGLFRLLKYTNHHRISPFIASQRYCIKVQSITQDGQYTFNISPIYYLGPDYPDHYESRTGDAFDQSAIIGLVRSTNNINEPATFNLGIDAGIAFKDAPVAHNKIMTLALSCGAKGMIANLSCEDHVTTKVLPWQKFGVPLTPTLDFEPLPKIA